MDNQSENQVKTVVAEKRGIRYLVPAVATSALVLSGQVMAEVGDDPLANLGTDAVATIKGGVPTLMLVGVAIIGVAAAIWVVRKVIGMIR